MLRVIEGLDDDWREQASITNAISLMIGGFDFYFMGMVAVVAIVVPYGLSVALALGIVLPAFRAFAFAFA